MAEEQSDARGEARQSFFAKQQLIASAKGIMQQLSSVVRSATLYPAAHPFLLQSADLLLAKIDGMSTARKALSFYIVNNELFFETHSVPIDQSLAFLVEDFIRRDIGGIVFKPGLTRDEIIRFSTLMNEEVAKFSMAGDVPAILEERKIGHIELHRVLLVDKKAVSAVKDARQRAGEVFMDAVTTVKEMVDAVGMEKAVNMRALNTMVHSMVDNVLENRDALMGLTSIKMYDEYTFAHSVNTSILAISLATYLSFEKPQIASLGVAGLLHDIGKVYIPHQIINKPDKLTDEEWEILKRHPVEGALILADVPGVTKLAMIGAFEHHQQGGARGYPSVGGVLYQHPFSQIIALADAYDAITAARVYYSVQTPPDKAVRILVAKRGSSFNPVLVKAFVNMVGLFPIGTLLKLNTGEIGLVVHQTRDLLRPHVLLLDKFDGSERENGKQVNLQETAGGKYKRTVVGTIDPYEEKINVKQYLG
ncbi:MAG: HD-GYP domain-containing protein [Nitrospiraceae bacterium]|nr:HD-GYP domain-containing protein [Nitrospiraceae bacterium]